MLAIGRRWRVLAGFAAGACVLGSLSLFAVGYGGCVAYIEALRLRAGLVTLNPSPVALFKYVDVQTFFRFLFGGYSLASAAAALILGGTGFIILALMWARSKPGTRADGLLWAATVTWTLVVNVSIPIYDTTLVVIGALVMAAAVYSSRSEQAGSAIAFLWWMLVLYLAAVVTEPGQIRRHPDSHAGFGGSRGARALRLSRRAGAAAA